jgi:hypothetical protein
MKPPPKYILPDDETPLARMLFRLSWGLFILAVILGIAAKVCAPNDFGSGRGSCREVGRPLSEGVSSHCQSFEGGATDE